MSASDWDARFGHAYWRIVGNILPEFSEDDLLAAEPHASAIYVPYGTFR